MSDVHLTQSELVAWRDSGVGDRTRIIGHLAVCAVCRQTAAELERSRPADDAVPSLDAADFVATGYRAGAPAATPRPRPRWTWAAAAAAVLAIAIIPAWLLQRNEEYADALRGAEAIGLVAPVNASVARDALAFEWTSPSDGSRMRLNVVDVERPAEPIIEREVTGSRYTPTDEERQRFEANRKYHWYIELRGASGWTSPAASFSIR